MAWGPDEARLRALRCTAARQNLISSERGCPAHPVPTHVRLSKYLFSSYIEHAGSVSVLSKGLAKPVAKHTNLLQKMSAQETKRSEVTELR